MTIEGVEKLISYQRSHYAKEWRYTIKAADLAEITLAYMDALEEYEDMTVLRAYLGGLKGWERMPSIAQIMTAAGGIARREEGAARPDGFACSFCGLPWDGGRGYGREEQRRRGYARCRNCSAQFAPGEMPPAGFIPAPDMVF